MAGLRAAFDLAITEGATPVIAQVSQTAPE